MRNRNLLAMGAIAILASCAGNHEIPEPGKQNPEEGALVALFNVNLPSTSGTRVEFENATQEENAVKNVQFFIYKSSDNDYECVAVSDKLTPSTQAGSNDVQVKATVAFKVTDEISTSDKLYGLAIVNVSDDSKNGFSVPVKGQKFSQWATVITATSGNPFIASVGDVACYTMTNAATWDYNETTAPENGSLHTSPAETGAKLTVLVKLDASAFSKAPSAPEKSAGTFYVQRGVAKVVVNENKAVPSAMSGTHKFELTAWQLDVTNTKTYPVQNVSNIVDEITAIGGGAPHFYTHNSASEVGFSHIWWAKDPNYDSSDSYTADDFKKESTVTGTPGSPQYCLENTMDYGQQLQDRVTRVILKGKYKIDGTEAKSFVFNPANDKVYVLGDAEADEISGADPDGLIALKSVVKGESLTTIAQALSLDSEGNGKVKYYKDGETYYTALIHHFDPAEEAPFDPADDISEGRVTYSAKHLGRFGVLRNNYYSITLNKVLGYGSPVIPAPDATKTADEVEKTSHNVEVAINVLKWAKREYGYEVK